MHLMRWLLIQLKWQVLCCQGHFGSWNLIFTVHYKFACTNLSVLHVSETPLGAPLTVSALQELMCVCCFVIVCVQLAHATSSSPRCKASWRSAFEGSQPTLLTPTTKVSFLSDCCVQHWKSTQQSVASQASRYDCVELVVWCCNPCR